MTYEEAIADADRKPLADLRNALNVEPSETPASIARRFDLTIIEHSDGSVVVHPLHNTSYQVIGKEVKHGELAPVLRAVLVCAFVCTFSSACD